ncbi:MraY family glycosyltransferase [Candidatus Deianiraea vastatrix]|uniref:Undecaprenyl-phosphate N-acetylglucosaminyl 1-phosphate transferase n=1 Tax=Candidatus Deianiraea vastatrix TaxID=2163644 RepID=A0A5B8XGI5_9RICK|nr:hypothetical protein [Candidatus Deianiraea vastatrix]QED23404.1 Putative undecaprenyl-phosphate N-acetylglucosaminyl 1-phosphate transferase [Candidatus Deianiraea vastatrix]
MNFWITIFSFTLSIILLISYIEIGCKFGITDKPDSRRNHKGELVRGGGIVLIFSALFSSLAFFYYTKDSDINSAQLFQILTVFVLLGSSFFIEDIKSLRRTLRFIIQFIAAGFGIMIAGDKALVFSDIPDVMNYLIVFIGWVWFMNLYNFMDGIDGMTATNTIFFALATLFISSLTPVMNNDEIVLLSKGLIPGFLAFLILNWHPSKVILGDSGSIAFGFLFGYIFLSMSHYVGILIPSLICSYYLLDASITLIMRIVKKENILEPHSKHFFQIALRSGAFSPRQICIIIALANIAILFISYMLVVKNSAYTIAIAIFLATFIHISLLGYFYFVKKS